MAEPEQSRLFEPLQVGSITLKHRIVMAPLTRFRSDDDHVPILPLVKEYYEQRASVPGTLLISEATFIAPQASGYDSVPGLWTKEQCLAWKEVTDAVHAKGSFIFCQLWALGRAALAPTLAKKGLDVVSSSPVAFDDQHAIPRELTETEIWEYVANYAQAAKNAVELAGFDGVEIHGANGYLIDQFTQDVCNKRTDSWGGSIENRARFGVEVASAVAAAIGPARTGIRLSPFSTFQGMRMADPLPQFTYLVTRLRELKLAFLHLVESRIQGGAETAPSGDLGFAISAWANTSPVFVAGGFTGENAREKVDDDFPDRDIAVVFGRFFISNPDLPFRILHRIPLTPYDRKTFYKPRSPEGYLDYPFSREWEEARQARL